MRTCCRWFQSVQISAHLPAAAWGHCYSSVTAAPGVKGAVERQTCAASWGREHFPDPGAISAEWYRAGSSFLWLTFPCLSPHRCSAGNRISLGIHPLHPLPCPPLHAVAVCPLQDRQQRLQHPDRPGQWAGQSCSFPCSSHPSTTPQHQPDLQCRENR